ncbi:MAG: hypothetical protein VX278_01740 [Myxococcota bacterium]|nr:hypothetical protein [Myxococcota bacterium]
MVLAHHKTGEPRYLAWLDGMAQHRRTWIDEGSPSGEEGDVNWSRSQIRKALHNGLRKHWMLTQSTAYTDLILQSADAYDRYRIAGEEDGWIAQLANTAKALSYNQSAYTSEVHFTDRVVKFHSAYWNDFAEEPLPSIDTELLYNMITGDWGSHGYIPLPRFRWNFNPRVLRVHVTSDRSAELFAVSDSDISGTVRILQQNNGSFALSCGNDSPLEGDFSNGELTLSLPSRTPCILQIND